MSKKKKFSKSKLENSKTEKKNLSNPVPDKKVIITPFYSSGFWKNNWWRALIVFVLPFILYFQATDYGYVLDDQIVITDNNFTKKGFQGIKDIMTTESMTGYFGEQKNLIPGNRYRPLSLVTFAMEYSIFGPMNSKVSHFINILLYGLTGLLLFRLLSMMFRKYEGRRWWLAIPFLAALLYIAHPIHSEAVANIKGRDEIMAMLLSLGSLYFILRYVDNFKKYIWLAMGSLTFFLALLAKENAITFLAVIPLTIYFFSNHSMKKSFLMIVPLLITTGIYLALRFSVSGVPDFNQEITDLMNNPFYQMSGGEKFATIMFTLWKYIQLFIFPHPLNHDYYPYEIPILNMGDFRAVASLLVYVGLAIWAIIGIRKKKVSSYAILYYLATLSIVSNIVINLGTFMNERFIYMASLGLVILLTYFISEKMAKSFGKAGMYSASALVLILLIGYSWKTIDRVPDWATPLTLNESSVKYGSNSARANSFMATAIYEEARELPRGDLKDEKLQKALEYAEKAIKIHPTYQNANLMKAGISAEIFRTDRDEKLLLKRFADVMSRRPDISYISEYLDYLDERADDMNYLLDWYVDTSVNEVLNEANRPDWALNYLNRAYNIQSNRYNVLQAIADVYTLQGNTEQAQAFQRQADLVRK